MIHTMNVKQPYFDLLKSGKKTIELRLFDEKRKAISIGDKIQFVNGDDKFKVEVIGLIRAENFSSLFDLIDPRCAGLDGKQSAIKIMEEFYSEDAQKKFGVVGIKVKK